MKSLIFLVIFTHTLLYASGTKLCLDSIQTALEIKNTEVAISAVNSKEEAINLFDTLRKKGFPKEKYLTKKEVDKLNELSDKLRGIVNVQSLPREDFIFSTNVANKANEHFLLIREKELLKAIERTPTKKETEEIISMYTKAYHENSKKYFSDEVIKNLVNNLPRKKREIFKLRKTTKPVTDSRFKTTSSTTNVFQRADEKGIISIVKPDDYGPNASSRGILKGDMPKNEVAAYEVSKEVGLSVVPETKYTILKGEVASEQAFVNETIELDEYIRSGKSILDVPRQDIEERAIFIIVSGAKDAHEKNTLITKSNRLFVIDNSYNFSTKVGTGPIGNIYDPGTEGISEIGMLPFSKESITKIKSINIDNIAKILEKNNLHKDAIAITRFRISAFKEIIEKHPLWPLQKIVYYVDQDTGKFIP